MSTDARPDRAEALPAFRRMVGVAACFTSTTTETDASCEEEGT